MKKLSERSWNNLRSVQDPLIDVVRTAHLICPYHFLVYGGSRTLATQIGYYEDGRSKTLNSRHLHRCAVDIAVLIDGKIHWDPWELYEDLAEAMFQAAHIHETLIEWGGHFAKVRANGTLRVFRDGGHFQLPRQLFPDDPDVLQEIRDYEMSGAQDL